jgi:DNA-binding CsgD family transcriptional regulator
MISGPPGALGDVADVVLQAGLSAAEAEVLFAVAEGQSYPEIAVRRGCSVRTVQSLASKARHRILAEFERRSILE